MSNKIQRYLQGNFDYEGGSLIFSCTKIEVGVSVHQDLSGSFFVEEKNGKEFSGVVYSSQSCMECLNHEISGTKVEISYRTAIRDRVGGDILKGEFYIITDVGEYLIPYEIHINYENIESSIGAIKNLFHFANLAKCNWPEAVSLFCEKNFKNILSGNDRRYRPVYNGLIHSGNPGHNLEEFLVCIHKKQVIEYQAEKEEICLVNPDRSKVQKVHIRYTGWGYIRLRVRTDVPFILLERTNLTENDFVVDDCEYPFFIDDSLLHEGNNYGNIVFEHAYGKITVKLNVVCKTKEHNLNRVQQQQKLIYRITRTFLDFQLRRLSMAKCILQLKESIQFMKELSMQNVEMALMEAHLLITQGNYNEAKWILDHGIDNIDELDDVNYCYYLYLTVLYSADEYYAMETADQVRSIYEKNVTNWRIAWIYMNLSPELNKSPTAKWTFGISQLEKGCNSPVVYIDLLKELNRMPALLGHLEPVRLRLVYYGARNGCLSSELCHQIVSLAGKTKQYQPLLLRTLKLIYEKRPDDDTLQAICILLMKGERLDEEAHSYYAMGVEYQLSITRLYECYILSTDLQKEEEIPKNVLMYFSYECSLPAGFTAYIYAYMHKNRERYSDLYDVYYPQIARFVVKELHAEKINADLAYLFEEFLLKEMFTPDNAKMFARMMFVNCVTVEEDDIKSVIVLDERLKEEKIYPVINHRAYVMLYGNEYTILLEDTDGKRYGSLKTYQLEKFFSPRKYLQLVAPYAKDNLSFALFVCGGFQDHFTVTGETVEQFRYLEQTEDLDDEYRYNIRMSLIRYYFEQDDLKELNELLKRTDERQVPVKYRAEFVHLLSIYGFTKKAYELILCFGVEHMNPKTVVKVCSAMIEQMEDCQDENLVRTIYSAFERGKYNDTVLLYLVKYYKGTVKIMRNIWMAASNFDIDTYPLCERILSQIVETGAFIGEEDQIFKTYAAASPNTKIMTGYLAYVCFEYLIFDRVSKSYIFEQIQQFYQQGEEIPELCKIAYLQFYSEQVDHLTFEQKQICQKWISFLYHEKRIVFPFFAEYRQISADAEAISHSLYVSYKGNPESRVVIHYMISRDDSEEKGYSRETMTNMFGGIFVKEFVLFFGESLQYYITEEYENNEQLTESGTLQNSDALPEETGSRFTMVNDIAMATTLKDYAAARELMEEYTEMEYMAKSLFSLQ